MSLNKKSVLMGSLKLTTPNMPGATRQYDFTKGLSKKGYKVAFFASSFSYLQHKETKLIGKQKWKIENIDGVNIVWIKSFPFYKNNWRRVMNILSLSMRSFWLGREIYKLTKDIIPPDVVIGNSVTLFQPLAMYYIAKYFKAKFIIEVGDLWPEVIVDMGRLSRNNPITKLLYAIEKFLYIKADRIISVLPYAKNYICSLGIPEEKVIWIPNGANVANYENLKERNTANSFNIMYLGSHAPFAGLGVVLEVAQIIEKEYNNDIQFILVGDGIEKKKLISRKNQLNLKNVQFWEPVPNKETPKVLQQADACLLSLRNIPALKYGMSSNKLFDYMAAKKPIIFCSNAPCDIIKAANCGIYVPPEDPKALVEGVIYLYNMPFEERQSMGIRGYNYVKKYYDLQALIDKFEQCIAEVIRED